MKWFKHMADASDNEFLSGLEEELGLEGYARWWKLLEAIARQMDGSDRCFAEYPVSKWLVYLSEKRQKSFWKFLDYCEKSGKISTDYSGNFLKISCRKLLELRDEYSRKSGQNPDRQQDNIASDKREKNKEINNPLLPLADAAPEEEPEAGGCEEPDKDSLPVNERGKIKGIVVSLLNWITPPNTSLVDSWLNSGATEDDIRNAIESCKDKCAKQSLSYFTPIVMQNKANREAILPTPAATAYASKAKNAQSAIAPMGKEERIAKCRQLLASGITLPPSLHAFAQQEGLIP